MSALLGWLVGLVCLFEVRDELKDKRQVENHSVTHTKMMITSGIACLLMIREGDRGSCLKMARENISKIS
jgi:hypothetical protein